MPPVPRGWRPTSRPALSLEKIRGLLDVTLSSARAAGLNSALLRPGPVVRCPGGGRRPGDGGSRRYATSRCSTAARTGASHPAAPVYRNVLDQSLPRITWSVILRKVIASFRNKGTEDLFDGRETKEARKSCPSDLVRVARRKLDQLNQAVVLGDLRAPPSNRLEKLRGEREGQYSIRINDQWRVCFRWAESGAEDVEIVDYH